LSRCRWKIGLPFGKKINDLPVRRLQLSGLVLSLCVLFPNFRKNFPVMQPPVIRCLQSDEMDFVMGLAAAEGWNPGLSDGVLFHRADPSGFFILESDGAMAGCISAVAYDDDYGFIGLYIVRPEFRGQGLGMHLWRHAME